MPLPIILGVGAAIAGAAGVGSGAYGAIRMKEANDILKNAEQQHRNNINRFETISELTSGAMDELGNLELNILKNFDAFSDTMAKIQNRPEFRNCGEHGVKLPEYNPEELEKASAGAAVILGALGGAALGTAGGFAASGVAVSAVTALGTASTGTVISTLSGAAATNAALAALGGGSLEAGGGGVLLGGTVLSGVAAGTALFVGGIIFGAAGDKMVEKADTAYAEMKHAEKTIDDICQYLEELKNTADEYIRSLKKVHQLYMKNFAWVSFTVNNVHKTDWCLFTSEEKKALENTVLLVGLLYKMCQINLVIKAESENEINKINLQAVNEVMQDAAKVSADIL